MISSLHLCLAMQPRDHSSKFSLAKTEQDSLKASPSPKRYFPFKLLQLLEDASKEGNEHVVSWLPHGKAFKVHKPVDFENKLIKRYFRQTKYRSFVRQLYHYRFARIDFGEDKGSYYHPEFQRRNKDLCISIQRNLTEDLQASSQIAHRIFPSAMRITPITPAINGGDFRIALGTGGQKSDIHASRLQYNNPLKPDRETETKPVALHPEKISSSTHTLGSSIQFSQIISTQQRSQDQNWLGAWLARHYSGNDIESGNVDLEPRPIEDMNN